MKCFGGWFVEYVECRFSWLESIVMVVVVVALCCDGGR